MKQLVRNAFLLSLLLGANALAERGHEHVGKPNKGVQTVSPKQNEKCAACKKDEKDCKCDDQVSHEGHDHEKEEKKGK